MIILLRHISVVCMTADIGQQIFRGGFSKIIIISIKSMNEWYKYCKKFTSTLYFSKKNKKIKNLKNDEKFVARYRQLYILLKISN